MLLRDRYLTPDWECPEKSHPDSFDVMTLGTDGQPGGDGEDKDVTNI